MVVEMVRGTLILAAMVIWPAVGLKTEDIFIKSYGVYLKYEGHIAASSMHWFNHFEIPLPTLSHFGPWYCSQSLDKIHKSHVDGCRRFVNATEQASLLPYVNQINSDVERHVQDFWKTVNEAFPSLSSLKDQSHETPTPEYDENEDDGKPSEEWQRIDNEYQSLKRLPNEGIKKIGSFLAENDNTLSFLAREPQPSTTTENQGKLKQMIGEFYLYNQTQSYIRYISDAKNAIQELSNRFLHPVLISDEQITEAVTKIKDELAKDGYASHLQYTAPHFYRRFGSYVVFSHENNLWISLKMKIGPLMSLFRVHVYPAPVRRNSNDIIRITGLPDLIMFDDKQFASLTDTDLSFCSGTLVKECQSNIVFTNINANTCEAALIMGNEDSIYQNCDFRLYRNKLLPNFELLPSSRSSVIVYNADTFNLTYNDDKYTQSVQGCFFCVMEIPCGCRIELNGKMAHSSHSHTCPHRHLGQLTSQLFQNLAVSKSFSEGNYGDGLFWNFKPLYRMYGNDFDPYLSGQQEGSYDLKLVAKEAAHNRTIYHSLSEALASGRLQVPNKLNDASVLVMAAISLIITSIIMFIFSIVICCYYHRRISELLTHFVENDQRKTTLDPDSSTSMLGDGDNDTYDNYKRY